MTKEQILAEFGDEMDRDAKSKLKESSHGIENTNAVYIRTSTAYNETGTRRITPGILGGLEAYPLRDLQADRYITSDNIYPVYECE